MLLKVMHEYAAGTGLYHALVRRMGGAKNTAARKKALVAIAHALLKIAWAVMKSG